MTSDLRATDVELRALLVEGLELLEAAAFDAAKASARRLRIPLERALVERARVPMSFLLEHLAGTWNVGYTNLNVSDVQPAALRKIKEEYAASHLVVAFGVSDAGLSVAMWDPRDKETLSELRRMTNAPIVPHLAPVNAIRRAHLLYHAGFDLLRQVTGERARSATDAARAEIPPADLVTRILEGAVLAGASDIHIEPYELEAIIRCRVDGALVQVLSIQPQLVVPLVARIKVLAGMRIDEKRAPQDGHFSANFNGLQVDLRVSTMPTFWGEKVVMRIVSKDEAAIDLEHLGLVDDDFAILRRHLMHPFGMILVTGPTGSGKTTTLYAMVAELGTERHNAVNLSTIEDPVERPISRVSQVSINPAAGIDFASGLRALLRQDPDIIMVGEIRDRDTAEMAVRAALVGRLLLSTLHTNDSVGAVARLLDMGIEPFLVASTLDLVIGQRLVRRICPACRESVGRDAAMLEALRSSTRLLEAVPLLQMQGVLPKSGDPLAGVRLYRGRGCGQCNGTGFRGRIGLFELFQVNDAIRRMIAERRDSSVIRTASIEAGMKTMFQDGLAKAFLGETTFEEAIRATA